MRELLLIFVVFSSILSCSSCRKEPIVGPSGTMTLSIKAVFGDEPFVAGQLYDYPSDGVISIDELAFFLSDISLITENGADRLNLDEIAYLDIASIQHDANSAVAGWEQVYYKVPVGEYKGVAFGLGVAHEENSQTPKDFSTGNPLGIIDRYSEQYISYVFEEVTGQYFLPNDTSAFNIAIVEDKLYNQVSLSKTFSVNESDNEIELIFDVKKIFQRNDSILDLAVYPVVVAPGLPQMEWLSKSFQHSFSF